MTCVPLAPSAGSIPVIVQGTTKVKFALTSAQRPSGCRKAMGTVAAIGQAGVTHTNLRAWEAVSPGGPLDAILSHVCHVSRPKTKSEFELPPVLIESFALFAI